MSEFDLQVYFIGGIFLLYIVVLIIEKIYNTIYKFKK